MNGTSPTPVQCPAPPGTLARFSSLLADYESVRRRARPDADVAGEQVGGEDRGTWYYKNLGLHIINYAGGAYEGFDGEPDFALNAVDLTTVHRAKGLEWPVVFVPSLTTNRFPTTEGRTAPPALARTTRTMFAAARYAGVATPTNARLFYVAATRAATGCPSHGITASTCQAAAPEPLTGSSTEVLEVDPADIAFVPNIEAGPRVLMTDPMRSQRTAR